MYLRPASQHWASSLPGVMDAGPVPCAGRGRQVEALNRLPSFAARRRVDQPLPASVHGASPSPPMRQPSDPACLLDLPGVDRPRRRSISACSSGARRLGLSSWVFGRSIACDGESPYHAPRVFEPHEVTSTCGRAAESMHRPADARPVHRPGGETAHSERDDLARPLRQHPAPVRGGKLGGLLAREQIRQDAGTTLLDGDRSHFPGGGIGIA